MNNERTLQNHLAAARGKSPATLLIELVDSVLRDPVKLAPLPKLAEERSQRMAEKLRDPKSWSASDEGGAKQRIWQWDQWYARVREDVERDGVRLLREMLDEGLAGSEAQRFELLAARVASLLRALRALGLPWWPPHREDVESRRELTLLDYCERELGRIETMQIRRAGHGELPSERRAKGVEVRRLRPRADVEDVSLDDWRPIEPLL